MTTKPSGVVAIVTRQPRLTDDATDAVRDQYEAELADRLAELLAAEFRRRLQERQPKERRDG